MSFQRSLALCATAEPATSCHFYAFNRTEKSTLDFINVCFFLFISFWLLLWTHCFWLCECKRFRNEPRWIYTFLIMISFLVSEFKWFSFHFFSFWVQRTAVDKEYKWIFHCLGWKHKTQHSYAPSNGIDFSSFSESNECGVCVCEWASVALMDDQKVGKVCR